MTTRYSGKITIRVLYDDRGYKASVTDGHYTWRGYIDPPASGFGPGIAYDSPRAYDSAAHAALSFANDEMGDLSEIAEYADGGWIIRRTKPKRASSPRRRRAK